MDNMIHQIQLKRNEIWKTPDLNGLRLRIVSGKAWVTYEGRTVDLVLRENECFPLQKGRALVESLSDTLVLEVLSPSRGKPQPFL